MMMIPSLADAMSMVACDIIEDNHHCFECEMEIEANEGGEGLSVRCGRCRQKKRLTNERVELASTIYDALTRIYPYGEVTAQGRIA